MYDVVIVGAGPAGSTAARLIGPGKRVLLVDKRTPGAEPSAGPAGKLCGGLLSPSAQRELARQGLAVPGEVTSGPQLFAVRVLDLETGDEQLYQRHYLNVDRDAVDRWLVSLVPGGVECVFGWSLDALAEDADGVMLTFATPGGALVTVRTALVIGADGASSLVRLLSHPGGAPTPSYTVVQGVFEAAGELPHLGAIFDSRITDHYGWTIPKRGRVLAGVALPLPARAAEHFATFIARSRQAGIALGAELSRGSAPVLRPGSARHVRLGTARVLLAGEAAGFISPSSAEGIGYALRSGAAVATALAHGGAPARAYRAEAAPLVAEVAVKCGKASVIGSAAARRAVMRSGLGAIRCDGRDSLAASLTEVLAP